MSIMELSKDEYRALVSSALHCFMESVNDGRCGYTDEAVGLDDLEDLAIKLFVRQNLYGAELFITLFLNSFAESQKDSELAGVLRGVARRAELFFRAAELFEQDVQMLLGDLYRVNERRNEERQRYARENNYFNPQIVTTQYQDNVKSRRAFNESQQQSRKKQVGEGEVKS